VAFRVEVFHEDGSIESFDLDAEDAIIGRSLEAHVSIPDARDLEPEHIRLRPQARSVIVEVLPTARVPVLVNGEILQSGEIPWTSELKVGSLRIRLLARQESRGMSIVSWIIVLLIPVAGVLVFLWSTRTGIEIELHSDLDPPAILQINAECPTEGESALAHAGRLMQAAEARTDRYPFSPDDGIHAVTLYGQAAACFEGGGDSATSGEARQRQNVLARRIQEDYRTNVLSLERAIETGRHREALTVAVVLYRYVKHTNGEYEEWVAGVIQKLALKIDRESRS
jgi:hypothetical protein